jgi:hypothetical protein
VILVTPAGPAIADLVRRRAHVVKKKLTHIPLVSARQVAFGARLGLDQAGCTVRVAEARIEDCVRAEFHGDSLLQATPKQILLAAEFGYDIAGCSRRVAHAVIGDLMEQLDRETIIAEGLAPGVTVTNIHDRLSRHFVVSSVQPDLLVYFKGGNGHKAYARSLRRVTTTPNDRAALDAATALSVHVGRQRRGAGEKV